LKNLLPRAAGILAEYIVAKNLPSPKLMSVRRVPIYKEGYWLDKYAKCFESKEESQSYPKKFLFLPRNGNVIPVDIIPGDQMFVHKKYADLKKTFNNNLLQKDNESNRRDDDS
jgi:hypothetical protein